MKRKKNFFLLPHFLQRKLIRAAISEPTSSRRYFYLFQSLTILASIPAAILIFSLFLLLLYLMTRCCDRKSKKQRTFGCQKCTLIFITILCCGAIGGGKWNCDGFWPSINDLNFSFFSSPPSGLYGNDDLHNGLVQVFNAGKQLNRLFINVRNQVSRMFAPFVS